MALQFSDTTNKNGIIELIEDLTGTQSSTTSSYSLVKKTRDINLAYGNYMMLANSAAGNWRPVDDTNQTDYPVVFADIVASQQDYSFTVDENGNQILDIYKVRAKMSDGTWVTLEQINQEDNEDAYLNSTDTTATPNRYYLTANGIFLVETPNYNSTDGLEIYINRTPSYFATSDTTKKPGIPDMFHEYLAMRPAYFYCLQKGLKEADSYRVTLYGQDGRSGIEGLIKKYYRDRNKAFQQRIISEEVCSI